MVVACTMTMSSLGHVRSTGSVGRGALCGGRDVFSTASSLVEVVRVFEVTEEGVDS